MWLSKQAARRQTGEKASVSPVTIGGAEAGVLSGAEVRQTQVFSPGGYFWRPQTGESVLVLKCGGETCIVGREAEQAPEGMENGEVYIKSKNGAGILLKNDGTVRITGEVEINGGLKVYGDIFVDGTVYTSGNDA